MKRIGLLTLTIVLVSTLGCPDGANEQVPEVAEDVTEDDRSDSGGEVDDGEVGLDEGVGDTGEEALPFELPSEIDDVTYVGVAEVDITPEILETFTDLNDNGYFDGCLDNPGGDREGCDEPFNDEDGDGQFDAVWIAGFDPKRAALDIHDAILVRTIAVVRNGEYIFLTGMDLVGLPQTRIDVARDVLVAEDGMAPERFIPASSHNHQGPDVFGIWGFTDLDGGVFHAGFDEAYQQRVVDALVASVRSAAAAVRPAEIVMAMEDMAERSAWFSGRLFDGINPRDHQTGLINDIRDPVIASTRVFVMHARDPETGNGIATLLNFSSHPETWDDENNNISADWVGVARDRIDAALGGLTVFMPECLGGMQSMLGAQIPQVDEDGDWVWQDGPDSEPVWAAKGTFDFVRSAGTHVADAALDALEGAEPVVLEPFIVRWNTVRVNIDNAGWAMGATLGIADLNQDDLIDDPEECPEMDPRDPLALGCWDTHTWRFQLGPLAVITAPGELLPEVFHGLPDDPIWRIESENPAHRGSADLRDSKYFPQPPAGCDDVAFEDCRDAYEVDDCDCLRMHDVPYLNSPDPAALPPLVTLLSTEATYRIATSATGNYMSYIIPENDFNTKVSLLSGPDGDHFEDTVSGSSTAATALVRAQLELGNDND